MEDFFNLILPFFAIIFLGYAFGRFNWIPISAGTALNAFVLKVCLPAFIFKVLLAVDLGEIIRPSFVVIHFLAGAFLYFVVFILYRRAQVDGPTAAYCAQSAMVPNNGYLGVPLIGALLGPVGAVAATLCLLVETLLFVPMAVIVAGLAAPSEAGEPRTGLVKNLISVYASLLKNPFVVAIVLASVASYFQISFPTGVNNFIDIVAAGTGPAALFAIGLSLAGRKLAEDRADILFLSGLKLVVHPMLVAAAFLIIPPILGIDLPAVWVLAAILVAALPTAAHVYVFAESVRADTAIISGVILVSSAVGLITFPAIKWLAQLLLGVE